VKRVLFEALAAYLAPIGKVPGVGPERGKIVSDGISRFRSPHGSTRYVYYEKKRPLAALQVVSRDGRHAQIANVYVAPEARRRGLASLLLRQARRDFRTVVHAADENVSEAGRRWKTAVRDWRRCQT
jgi:GNAT superfamily N-acetyltransferase